MTGWGRVGGVYAALHGAHMASDYIVQTGHQAAHKGDDGWAGRRACAAHVASLTATQALFLGLGAISTGERLNPRRVATGLAFNAVTHYAADRRGHGIFPKLMAGLDKLTGHEAEHPGSKRSLYRVGAPRDGHDDNPCLGTGSHFIDQAFHDPCLVITAYIIAGRSPV